MDNKQIKKRQRLRNGQASMQITEIYFHGFTSEKYCIRNNCLIFILNTYHSTYKTLQSVKTTTARNPTFYTPSIGQNPLQFPLCLALASQTTGKSMRNVLYLCFSEQQAPH